MPFTPFHLGPALFLSMLLFPFVDVTVIFIASIIIDVEPAYYLLFTSKGAYHGYLHTYLGSTIFSTILALITSPFRKYYLRMLKSFGLKQETSFRKILGSYLIGTYSHVFLDSFLYPEMNPLYPFSGNPCFKLLTFNQVYGLCILTFILGLFLYIFRIR